MRTSSLAVLPLVLSSLLLGGCQRETAPDADPAAAGADAATSAAQAATSADAGAGSDGLRAGERGTSATHGPNGALPAYCIPGAGTAPRGELVATRIAAADGDGSKGLYEGPVWNGEALYFSDFTFAEGFPSKIRRLDADGTVHTVIDPSGSNGLALGEDGALIAATHDRKEISRFDLADGSRMRISGEYAGQPFNSPNDLVVATDGTIWFTDPDYQRTAAPGGQDRTRVYRIGTDGGVDVVDDSLHNPNGIALSPDGNTLYVAGGEENGVLRAYPLASGSLRGGHRDLVTGIAGPDGLAVDCLGNIYLTEHAGRRVRVVSPQGQPLATIAVDANLTNAAFGGPQRRTLYLTGAGAIWSIELDVAGLPY
ncbi:SMP-30/gluconolactonase/LRE family protein [Pseudoxanthomonas koreensis]|uniref:SMP-30/gluconolactonase/LRE family protein n=1 Tax=Pseudoxanthomonas koreensis TaxID=266061 RepID=UPI001391D608|nr:SMP-30/gluconolactonase/LRE family protein [Pseudoxanthomonas koreensis]KAF1689455.1 gluconolactonase [Pseudoxanthomonas koreensis]